MVVCDSQGHSWWQRARKKKRKKLPIKRHPLSDISTANQLEQPVWYTDKSNKLLHTSDRKRTRMSCTHEHFTNFFLYLFESTLCSFICIHIIFVFLSCYCDAGDFVTGCSTVNSGGLSWSIWIYSKINLWFNIWGGITNRSLTTWPSTMTHCGRRTAACQYCTSLLSQHLISNDKSYVNLLYTPQQAFFPHWTSSVMLTDWNLTHR